MLNKAQLKKKQCLEHRKERYLSAIQRLIDGKSDPEYTNMRWNKLKEVAK